MRWLQNHTDTQIEITALKFASATCIFSFFFAFPSNSNELGDPEKPQDGNGDDYKDITHEEWQKVKDDCFRNPCCTLA